MLEIIAIILLAGQIGRMAIRKGQRPGVWKLYMVLAWIGGEVIGVFIAIAAFNKNDYIGVLPLGIMGAVGGYLIVRAILSNMPDKPEEGFEFEKKTEN
jgi:hypothetical protein